MTRRRYTSDLTDAEWAIFDARFKELRKSLRGRPPINPQRETVNAILYRLRTGCQWRDLPHDFPDWQAVYSRFRAWKEKGLWQRLHDVLRREVRVQEGRDPEPSALIIDSQSVKADDLAEASGYDAGKKNQGTQAPCGRRRVGTAGLRRRPLGGPARPRRRPAGAE